jgi:hypothetical protein
LESGLDRLISIVLSIAQGGILSAVQITAEPIVDSIKRDTAQASVVVVQVLLGVGVGVAATTADAVGSRSHSGDVVCRVRRLKLGRGSLSVASGRADLGRGILLALEEVHIKGVTISRSHADGRGSLICLRGRS